MDDKYIWWANSFRIEADPKAIQKHFQQEAMISRNYMLIDAVNPYESSTSLPSMFMKYVDLCWSSTGFASISNSHDNQSPLLPYATCLAHFQVSWSYLIGG